MAKDIKIVYTSLHGTGNLPVCRALKELGFTDNRHYTKIVKRESIAVILFSIIAIIISVFALIEENVVMDSILMKLFIISFVTLPIVVVYNDYKVNVEKENELEV